MSDMDLSSFSEHQMELEEDGQAYRQEDVNAIGIMALHESLDQIIALMTGFTSKINSAITSLALRVDDLEKNIDHSNFVIHILSQRSDWMMEGREDLKTREKEFLKADVDEKS